MPNRPENFSAAEWTVVWDRIEAAEVNSVVTFKAISKKLAIEMGERLTDDQSVPTRFVRMGRELGGKIANSISDGNEIFPIEFLGNYVCPILRKDRNGQTWDTGRTEEKPLTKYGSSEKLYKKNEAKARDD